MHLKRQMWRWKSEPSVNDYKLVAPTERRESCRESDQVQKRVLLEFLDATQKRALPRFGTPSTSLARRSMLAAAIALVAIATAGQTYCSNTCNTANDGECDDGGPGAEFTSCNFGTDCNDCGQRSIGQYICVQPSTTFSDGNCAGVTSGSYTYNFVVFRCCTSTSKICMTCLPPPSPPPSPPSPPPAAAGGGGAPGGGGATAVDPCFPSDALVTMVDGTPRRLDALRAGDTIVAARADGTLTNDLVSHLSLADTDVKGTSFVVLTTESGRNVTLTPTHHVPVGPTCCANLKEAKDIVVGETVYEAVVSAAVRATQVKKIGTAIKPGLHSPVLSHGAMPIVNGVVTSFDSMEIVRLAAYTLPLLEATGLTATFRDAVLAQRKYIRSHDGYIA